MDTDCGSTICHIEFKVLPSCHLYVKTPGTNCSIPCFLENCKKELHFNVRCPVILCYPKTTTTTTMAPTTTVSPLPNECSNALCISSVVFNLLLLLILIFGGIWVFKKVKHLHRARTYQQVEAERPVARNLENPIFEDIPLISNERPQEISTGTRMRRWFRSVLQNLSVGSSSPDTPSGDSSSNQIV